MLYSKAIATVVFGLAISNMTFASELTLKSTPPSCFIDKSENRCSTYVELSWVAKEIGPYCLYAEEHTRPLRCWENQNHGSLMYQEYLKENTIFTLIKIDIKNPVRVTINVSAERKIRGNLLAKLLKSGAARIPPATRAGNPPTIK